MDPLSVIASSVSIADVCVRLVSYLRDVHKATKTVEHDIASLIHEIQALNVVNLSIKRAYNDLLPSASQSQQDKGDDLWKLVARNVRDCEAVVAKLEVIAKEIYGKTGPAVTSIPDAVAKTLKRKSREGELRQCRDQLTTYQNVLQVILKFIDLHSTRQSQKDNARAFKDLLDNLRHVETRVVAMQDSLESSNFAISSRDGDTISALRGLRESVEYAASTIKSVSSNKHFDIPQPVSSIFTGREDALKDLQQHFFASPTSPGLDRQRRFVVYGIGGSGKTQFCSKFAEDNRESFWGVFWVNASTTQRIQQTYSKIAKLAGVEPNENAAMHWLSNLEHHWLLIIDNADDPRIPLEKYLPKGNRGNILVTTRNPAHKVHGNVGPGFLEFHGLNFREANDLLLKAANQPTPWDSMSETSASSITKALGFLVLAIIHAGAAIREGLCTLKTYLSFYERGWNRLRRTREGRGETVDETEDHMDVYTTWEICFQHIESKANEGKEAAQDAIQLLTTFSFLHWEEVRYDTLRRALENPLIEARDARKGEQAQPQTPSAEPLTLAQKFRNFNVACLAFVFRDRSPAALPHCIRDARKATDPNQLEEFHDRLRYALKELLQMSLITHNEANDSFSMHPIVHQWARKRPGMRLAEQALWAEATATMISSSLLLPHLRNDAHDEDHHRDVLPHVDHVNMCRDWIREHIGAKLQKHWSAWFLPRPRPVMTPSRAIMYAKFSVVYSHCGRWDKAEQLQSEVKSYTEKFLGTSNEKSRRITLALAGTYWNMGRGAEAERLQRDVLNTCLTSLGPEHLDTLRAKDMLASTIWQRGRYHEAEELQREALRGLQKLLGAKHEDALNTLDNLARTVAKFWEDEHLEEAYKMHTEAIEGMEEVHGADHPRTLIAKENLVRVAVYIGGDATKEAEELITRVIEDRKRKLGKEHPYTLLAMANAALVKCALGHPDQAEELILAGLPIAERNLGEDHIGTLWGYHTLGSVRIRQRRYREAEDILVNVVRRQRKMQSHRGEYHPDRLGAMIELAKCYRLQNKISESIRMCDETLKGFEEISTREHPLARDMKRARQRMIEHQQRITRGEPGDEVIAKEAIGVYKQFHIFGG